MSIGLIVAAALAACADGRRRYVLRSADPDRLPVDCMTREAPVPFRLPGGR